MKAKPLESTFTHKYLYSCFSGAYEQGFLCYTARSRISVSSSEGHFHLY